MENQKIKCIYPNCKNCKIPIFNAGPNYLEDLKENCERGCFLAKIQLEQSGEFNETL